MSEICQRDMQSGNPLVCPPSPSAAGARQVEERTMLFGTPQALFARGLQRPTSGGMGVNVGSDFSIPPL